MIPDQAIIAARAVATSRSHMAAIVGMAEKSLVPRIKKLGLPNFRRELPADLKRSVCDAYASGKSMQYVAAEHGMTRNQVAGILSRCHMFSKLGKRKATFVAARRPRPALEPKMRKESARLRTVAVESLRLEFAGLKAKQCRWPTEGGNAMTYRFCGHHVEDRYPRAYCAAHAALTYVAPNARHREARPR